MQTELKVMIDEEIKERSEALAEYLDVPLSTVVNMYLHEFLASGEFPSTAEPQLRPEVAERLEREVEESKQGKGLSPVYTNAEDFMCALNP